MEALVVLAIVAILATIAYPSYVNQVRKSKRTVAKSALLDAANREEQNFFSQRSYTSLMFSSSLPLPPNLNYRSDPAYFADDGTNLDSSANAVYAVSVAAKDTSACGGAPCFKLQAVPLGDQANDACGTFTLSNSNGITKSAAVSDCW